MLDRYVDQVRLLLSVLPDIAAEDVFALKGGTAINLFYRDMPRLSIDIDLTYLPVGERETSLRDIDETLDRILGAVTRRNPRVQAQRVAGGGKNDKPRRQPRSSLGSSPRAGSPEHQDLRMQGDLAAMMPARRSREVLEPIDSMIAAYFSVLMTGASVQPSAVCVGPIGFPGPEVLISGCQQAVEKLAERMTNIDPAGHDREAVGILRDLIHSVVVHDRPDGGVEAEVIGHLSRIVGDDAEDWGDRW